jgi:hypothetical protein
VNTKYIDELLIRITFSHTIGAMRRNYPTATSTEAEIESVCKDWFRFAKDRNGGRKEREKKRL